MQKPDQVHILYIYVSAKTRVGLMLDWTGKMMDS